MKPVCSGMSFPVLGGLNFVFQNVYLVWGKGFIIVGHHFYDQIVRHLGMSYTYFFPFWTRIPKRKNKSDFACSMFYSWIKESTFAQMKRKWRCHINKKRSEIHAGHKSLNWSKFSFSFKFISSRDVCAPQEGRWNWSFQS